MAKNRPLFRLLGFAGAAALLSAGVVAHDTPSQAGANADTRIVLPYEAAGYRYVILGSNSPAPLGFEKPGFDDSSWKVGQAAFGNGGAVCPQTTHPLFCTPPGCTLQHTVRTHWGADQRLAVRRSFNLPAGARNVRLMLAVDNDVMGVYLNGKTVPGYRIHEGCPSRDEFRFDLPPSLLQTGTNQLALLVHDRGGGAFFDASVLADVPRTTASVPLCTSQQLKEWNFINQHQQGVGGRAVHGHYVGHYPAEKSFTSADTWFPVSGSRSTACGRLDHFDFYESGITNEYDWNNYIRPRPSHGALVLYPLSRRLQQVNDCRNRVPAAASWLCPDISAWYNCGEDTSGLPVCIDGEIEPAPAFENNPWFPKKLGWSPLEAPDCELCMYGPWVFDCWAFPDNHDCRPEIHPSELMWWRGSSQGGCVVPNQADVSAALIAGELDIHYLLLQNDNSDKFADTGDFDRFPNFGFFITPPLLWRPWAAAPQSAEFRLALSITAPAQTSKPLSFDVQQLSGWNLATATDPFRYAFDETTAASLVMRYNGRPIVTVKEGQPNDRDLGVGFAEVCRNPSDTRLQGYLRIHTSVETGGHHMLAIVSRGQEIDLSPPPKSRGHRVVWAEDRGAPRWSPESNSLLHDPTFELDGPESEAESGATARLERLHWIRGDTATEVPFDVDEGSGRYTIENLQAVGPATLELTLDNGETLRTRIPGLGFVPTALGDGVEMLAGDRERVWAQFARLVGGTADAQRHPDLEVRQVVEWSFRWMPEYAPLIDGRPAPEDESFLSRELDRATALGVVEELERLYGTSEPFEVEWSFIAWDAATGDVLDVRRVEDLAAQPAEQITVALAGGRYPDSLVRVRFPDDERLVEMFAVAEVVDAIGHRGTVVKLLSNHVLSAESAQTLSESALFTLPALATVPEELFLDAASSGGWTGGSGFVADWILDPARSRARAARIATSRAAADRRITPYELADLVGAARAYSDVETADADGDGVSDVLDLCPNADDREDADGDGFPDCLE